MALVGLGALLLVWVLWELATGGLGGTSIKTLSVLVAYSVAMTAGGISVVMSQRTGFAFILVGSIGLAIYSVIAAVNLSLRGQLGMAGLSLIWIPGVLMLPGAFAWWRLLTLRRKQR